MVNVASRQSSLSMYPDGTRVMDAKERKRYQNRVAQRTYRHNQKLRLRALEQAVGHPSNKALPSLTTETTSSIPDNDPQEDQIWCLPMNDNPQSDFIFPQSDVSNKKAFDSVWEEITPPETPSTLGRTALHRAVCNKNESILQVLIDQGADIKRQDSNGQTALHLAVESGQEGLVKVLLKKCDPNVKDSLGRTALFEAVQGGSEVVAKLLLDAAIDVNSKDTLGEVALHLAVESGSEALTLLLLKYGADVDA